MLKLFLSYYRPYKGMLSLLIAGSFATAGIELLFPLIVRQILNTAIPQRELDALLQWSGVLLVLYLANSGLVYALQYYGHVLGIKIENNMRRDVFAHLQQLSFRFFDNHKTGQLLARLTGDVSEVSELAFRGPNDIIVCLCSMAGTIIMLLWLNPYLGVLVAVLLLVKTLHTILVNDKMKTAFMSFRAKNGDITARAEEALSGIRLTKAFAMEEKELEKFDRVSAAYLAAKCGSFKILAYFICSIGFFTNFTNLLVMAVGGMLVIYDKMLLSDFVAFFLYVGIFMKPLLRLTAFTEIYQRGMAGFARIYELLQEEPEIRDVPQAAVLEKAAGNIEFEHVSFGYHGGQEVLKDLHLQIAAGETVAFVGGTGVGKTTVVNLLMRFYEPTGGRILLDGQDITQLQQASLRRQIGLVQQDVFLFSASVRDNIAYGQEADDEAIREAAVNAAAADFIEALPDKYATEIGERGVKLSGGQKQRLAIARMFLKNPPIVILDEATSALDNKTERQIQEALERLSQGRTTLIIAHRLSTVRHADKIAVLDKGTIAEFGTHAELLARRGLYYQMWHVQ